MEPDPGAGLDAAPVEELLARNRVQLIAIAQAIVRDPVRIATAGARHGEK